MTSPIWTLFAVKILGISSSTVSAKKIILIIVNFIGLIITIEPSFIFGSFLLEKSS